MCVHAYVSVLYAVAYHILGGLGGGGCAALTDSVFCVACDAGGEQPEAVREDPDGGGPGADHQALEASVYRLQTHQP